MTDIASKLAEVQRRMGQVEGRHAALMETTAADADFRDALRVRAWWERDRKALRLNSSGDDVVAPEGWPDGVDPDAYVDAALRPFVKDFAAPRRDRPAQANPGGTVLHDMLGKRGG